MNSAIAGLRAHQTKLDVTGNNIANVNTVGYKSSTTVFEDTLSQVMRNGSAPTAQAGGTNPAQVGLGVKVAGITTNFEQGAAQNTGRSTDFMISGDGFFVTRAGNEQLYTRAGSFSYDATGNLVTPDGALLQGWMAEAGVVDTNRAIGTLTVPFGDVMQPTRTTTGAVVGNLSSAASPGTGVQTPITVYDALGTANQGTIAFTKHAAANTWNVRTSDGTNTLNTQITFATTPGQEGLPATGAAFEFTRGDVTWPDGIQIDLADLRQFGGAAGLCPARVDGNAMGALQSISLSGEDRKSVV